MAFMGRLDRGRVLGLFLLVLISGDHALGSSAKLRRGVLSIRGEQVTAHLAPLLTGHRLSGDLGAASLFLSGDGRFASPPSSFSSSLSTKTTATTPSSYVGLGGGDDGGEVDSISTNNDEDAAAGGFPDLTDAMLSDPSSGLAASTALESHLSPLWDGDAELDLLIAEGHMARWDWLARRKAEAERALEHARRGAASISARVGKRLDAARESVSDFGDALGEKVDEHLDAARESVSDFGDAVGQGWDSVVSAAQERYDEALGNLRSHMSALSIRGVERLRELRELVVRSKDWFTGVNHGPEDISGMDIVGAVLFGFLNGFLMGIGDMVRNALNHPDCAEKTRQVRAQMSIAMDSTLTALLGLFDGGVRNGLSRRETFRVAIEDILQLLKDLWALISGCPPLLMVVGMVVLVVAVSVVIILLLAATVVGLLVKIAAIIVTLVTGIKFVWDTVAGIITRVRNCAEATADPLGRCAKVDILGIVEGVLALAGFVVQVVVLSGLDKIVQVRHVQAALKSKSLRSLKIKWHPEMADDFARFGSQMKSLKDGARVNFDLLKIRVSRSVDRVKAAATSSRSARREAAQRSADVDMFNGQLTNKVGLKNSARLDDIFAARKMRFQSAQKAADRAKANVDEALAKFQPEGKPPAGSKAEADLKRLVDRAAKAQDDLTVAQNSLDAAEVSANQYKWEGGTMEKLFLRKGVDPKAVGAAHKHMMRHAELTEKYMASAGKYNEAALRYTKMSDEYIGVVQSGSKAEIAEATRRLNAAEDVMKQAANLQNEAIESMKALWRTAEQVPDEVVSSFLKANGARYAQDASRGQSAINDIRGATITRIKSMLPASADEALDPARQLIPNVNTARADRVPYLQALLRKLEASDEAARATKALLEANVKSASLNLRAVLKKSAFEISRNRGSIFRVLSSATATQSNALASTMVDATHYKYRITVMLRGATMRPSSDQKQRLSVAGAHQLAYLSVFYDGAAGRTALVDVEANRARLGDIEMVPVTGAEHFIFHDKVEIYTNSLDHPLRIAGILRRDIESNDRLTRQTTGDNSEADPAYSATTESKDEEAGVWLGQAIGVCARKPPAPSRRASSILAGDAPGDCALYPLVPQATKVRYGLDLINVPPGVEKAFTYSPGAMAETPEEVAFGNVRALVVTERLGGSGGAGDSDDSGDSGDLDAHGVDTAPLEAPTRIVVTRGKHDTVEENRQAADLERTSGAELNARGHFMTGVREDRCEVADASAAEENPEGLDPARDCFSFQIESIVGLKEPPRSEGGPIGRGKPVWLQCREAVAPTNFANSARCSTDFGRVACSSRVNGGKYAGGGKVVFTNLPRFRACGRFSAMQCEVRWSGGSLGAFRVAPDSSRGVEDLKLFAAARDPLTVIPSYSPLIKEVLMRTNDVPVPTMHYLFGKAVGTVHLRLVDRGAKYASWISTAQQLIEGQVRGIHNTVLFLDALFGLSDPELVYARFRHAMTQVAEDGKKRNTLSSHGTCPLALSHRGVGDRGDIENTLQSFVKSAGGGLDGTELDVFLAGSERVGWTLTALHDQNLDRLTGYGLDITGFGDEQLETFQSIKTALSGCFLFPDAWQVFEIAKVLGMSLDVELKPESPLDKVPKGYSSKIGAEVGRLLRKYDLASDAVVTGFDPAKLKNVNPEGQEPRVQVGMGHHGSFGSTAINAVNDVLGLDGRAAKSDIYRIGHFSKRKVAGTHRKGGYAGVYTFHDVLEDRETRRGAKFYAVDSVRSAVEAKVDWMETDNVDKLYEAYEEVGCKPRYPRADIAKVRHSILNQVAFMFTRPSRIMDGQGDELDEEEKFLKEIGTPDKFRYKYDDVASNDRDNKRSAAIAATA